MLASNLAGMRQRSHPLGDWKETHLPNKGLDTAGTTVGLVEGNLTNNLATELPAIILSDEMLCDGGQ